MYIGKCNEIILLTLCAISIVSYLQMPSFDTIQKNPKTRIQNIVFMTSLTFSPH